MNNYTPVIGDLEKA